MSQIVLLITFHIKKMQKQKHIIIQACNHICELMHMYICAFEYARAIQKEIKQWQKSHKEIQ